MEQQLNETPQITALKPLTYSRLLNNIDAFKTSNSTSRYTFLNLQRLVENFRLGANFISKSYYQSRPEYAYNDPPKGPIPQYFECVHCEKQGPDSHLKNCIKPFESSLYLTEDGEDVFKRVAGTSYKLIVKKRGQKKVISTSVKNQRFLDNVEIIYRNTNDTETIIKIGKNGVINIISANFDNSMDLESSLIKQINQTGALITENYGSSTFVIDPSTSYTYLILAQFNLYDRTLENLFINLKSINLNLWETPLFRVREGKINYFVIGRSRYQVENYRYNRGDITSRSNRQTNPFIQFDLIVDSVFKLGVLVYKRGAVQLRLSYLNKKFDKKTESPLKIDTVKRVSLFLQELFRILIVTASETNYPIIASVAQPEKKGIRNMVDSTQPKVCHNRPGRELRPVPYSFYGTCPMQGYYVRPEGKKRPDGLYEPCCYKIKKSGQDSLDYIKDLFRNGYKLVTDPDKLSAVFIPGTRTVESRRFNGLEDLTQDQLLDFMEQHGYIGKRNPFVAVQKTTLEFERFTQLTTVPRQGDFLITTIPNGSVRTFLEFNEKTGASYFINEIHQSAKSSLQDLPVLAGTVMDGYLDIDNEIYYPFDIPVFQGRNVSKTTFKKRFEYLNYVLEQFDEDSNLTLSINFDDSVETIRDEPDTFIIFIGLKSNYTPGQINHETLLWTEKHLDNFISLNVEPFKTNRWQVSYRGKSIPEPLLPQREKVKLHEQSIEIPVAFTNSNDVDSGDIVLFLINRNVNGSINNNKPLKPIKKITSHINDYSEIINILEAIKNPLSREQLVD